MNTQRVALVVALLALAAAVASLVLQWRLMQAQSPDTGLRAAAGASVGEIRSVPAAGSATAPSGATTTELARLRADVEQLKTRTQALGRMALSQVEKSAPLDLRPAAGWKNAGRLTPAAALETFFWAGDGGDIDTLAASILLEPDARERVEALLARLPAATRAEYDTPEKFVALFMARDSDIRAMQVLNENVAGDEALVNVRAQKGDGKTKEDGYSFRRVGDGWRLVVPGKAVDKYGKKLTDPEKKKN